MHPLITRHLGAIRALAREYGVARLEVFGSVCTPEWNPETSDIDFIVDYAPGPDLGSWLDRYIEFAERLEALLGRPVDLVMAGSPAMKKKWFRRLADQTRTVIFDASGIVHDNLARSADEHNKEIIEEVLLRLKPHDPEHANSISLPMGQ